jgi:hypothetical protein
MTIVALMVFYFVFVEWRTHCDMSRSYYRDMYSQIPRRLSYGQFVTLFYLNEWALNWKFPLSFFSRYLTENFRRENRIHAGGFYINDTLYEFGPVDYFRVQRWLHKTFSKAQRGEMSNIHLQQEIKIGELDYEH